MKKNLLTVALMALSLSVGAQVIFSANKDAVFYVGENALVYNGGGVQTVENGIYDVHGNVMIVGSGSDLFKTLATGGGDKLDGGNIILRLNTPSSSATSTYGQLFINGLAQGNMTAIVDKEYRTPKHGTYQQIALPFRNKLLSSLSGSTSSIGTFGKTFADIRYSKNEILTWNNITAVSDNLSVSATTPKNTTYYMLGSNSFDSDNPPALMPSNPDPSDPAFITNPNRKGVVYTLRGQAFANGITESLKNAANGVIFGTGGNNNNSYNEKYNTYLQDDWEATTPWAGNYGRNIYQFGNPYFTNLDLGFINKVEAGATTDGNNIPSIQGVRYDPGTVVSLSNGSTYSVGAKFINFTDVVGNPNASFPVGDVGLIIKPMQTFVIKLRNNNPEVVNAGVGDKTLYFDNLRRFKNSRRMTGTDYDVNALKSSGNAGNTTSTVKQLGVIGLDENGQELARTYFAVYPTATTGHTTQPTVQSTLGNENILGTYEEDINGGYDMNYKDSYWLYINEANETDFLGKALPLALYSSSIKSLKFEVRENAELIPDGEHNLSTGIGFYYKSATGAISEIAQNQVIPVLGDQYNLYYGKSNIVLGTGGSTKPSRTKVVYNGAINMFVVRFDPQWKKSDINVYDMSGKLIISQKDVLTDKDFEINLSKMNSAYIVTAVSEKGEKVSSKIIR
ncbi:T9SS type A sorting domain-containing protein [Kaistella sp. G5-32]|uniref:T9SS type A sorting domain-containing protein n=1 Tax=Kaistella gelatinilytica TaxID=2787636 RepID=A0ABS0FEZ8_9FLAO|nr:T9SS type A sorting domain-containing protein [Kaistella gelatinilytica]MBF8458289.1 T9SS type A sorting domain-containing protein [Kaistella gelatinilytica]